MTRVGPKRDCTAERGQTDQEVSLCCVVGRLVPNLEHSAVLKAEPSPQSGGAISTSRSCLARRSQLPEQRDLADRQAQRSEQPLDIIRR